MKEKVYLQGHKNIMRKETLLSENVVQRLEEERYMWSLDTW